MSRTDFFEINGKNIYFWLLNFKSFSYINPIQSIIVLKIKKYQRIEQFVNNMRENSICHALTMLETYRLSVLETNEVR